jgi:hypothetical protein
MFGKESRGPIVGGFKSGFWVVLPKKPLLARHLATAAPPPGSRSGP